MTTLKATAENNTIVKALKKISETKWVGNTTFDNLDACLTSINLQTAKNSGWYKPAAITINGLSGIYMINQDGTLCYDYRVIKTENNQYKIEILTTTGFNEFEQLYSQLAN